SGAGCPFCCGNRVAPSNSLRTKRPALAREWHSTKNGRLTPDDVTPGSNRVVWWRCSRDSEHVWKTAVGARGANGRGCAFCAGLRVTSATSLAAREPAAARWWHPTKNGDLTPRDVTVYSHQRVWWQCPRYVTHIWQRGPARQMRHG